MPKMVFQCAHCGALYATERDAEECENKHCIVRNIKYYVYEDTQSGKNKYPSEIRCEMSDGNTVIFYREKKWR